MFLTASVLIMYYFTVWVFVLFYVLDVEEEQDRKNVLNMLAKAFPDLDQLFCLLQFNVFFWFEHLFM